MTIKTPIIATMIFSVLYSPISQAANIFQAWIDGGRQARADNYRDAQRYYELERARIIREQQELEYLKQLEEYKKRLQPGMTFGVYTVSNWERKQDNVVSLSNNEWLCWMAYNIPNTSHIVRESFLTPSYNKFGGAVKTEYQNFHTYRETDRLLHFERHIPITTDNNLQNCWDLSNDVDRGSYKFELKIDGVSFGVVPFYVVD